jgi:DNA-binding transcriptional regulator YiaG
MNFRPQSPWPERIVTIRIALDWSQGQLAMFLRCQVTTIANWEQGRTEPQPHFQHRLRELEREKGIHGTSGERHASA